MDELELPSGRTLLVQSDAARSAVYGGNKARKFSGIVAEARRLGKTRLVSVGAIGSHHVLATALFARAAGLSARCFVVAQPDVPSTHDNARRALAAGAELVPVASELEAALRLGWALRDPAALVIPVGGSSVAGTEPYVDAAAELAPLANRLRTLVVGLGSGGTAVGLAIGGALAQAPWSVEAVATAGPLPVVRGLVVALAARVLAKRRAAVWPRLHVVTSQLGGGYARPTAASESALRWADARGLALEPVYTAKVFAHVLALDARGVAGLGYWHTAAASAPIDESLPPLPGALRRLFVPIDPSPS